MDQILKIQIHPPSDEGFGGLWGWSILRSKEVVSFGKMAGERENAIAASEAEKEILELALRTTGKLKVAYRTEDQRNRRNKRKNSKSQKA